MSRAESSLPVRCLRRFAAINGRDRALVMGGQAFTTIIPLLIVVAAAASRQGPTVLADRMAARFHVTGASAQAIRTLFERPPGATGTITIAGLVVLGVLPAEPYPLPAAHVRGGVATTGRSACAARSTG